VAADFQGVAAQLRELTDNVGALKGQERSRSPIKWEKIHFLSYYKAAVEQLTHAGGIFQVLVGAKIAMFSIRFQRAKARVWTGWLGLATIKLLVHAVFM
jgi:hypothetical protein